MLSWSVIVDVIFLLCNSDLYVFIGYRNRMLKWYRLIAYWMLVFSCIIYSYLCLFSVIQIAWNALFWVHHLFMHPVPFRICTDTLENPYVNGRCSFKFYVNIHSCQYWSLSIPLENTRKPLIFWYFQGVYKKPSDMKWVNFYSSQYCCKNCGRLQESTKIKKSGYEMGYWPNNYIMQMFLRIRIWVFLIKLLTILKSCWDARMTGKDSFPFRQNCRKVLSVGFF